MAEAFGLVATCIGLVSQIGKAIKTIDTLIDSYQSVPSDLENLVSWLKTTKATIQILQAALDTPGKVDETVKHDFDRSLTNCLKTVTRLYQSLEGLAASAGENGATQLPAVTVDVSARLKFLWNNSSIVEEKMELHQHMQAVDVLLHVVQLHVNMGYRPENATKIESAITYTGDTGLKGPSTTSTVSNTPAVTNNHRRFSLSWFGKRKMLHEQLCKAAAQGDIDMIHCLAKGGARLRSGGGSENTESSPVAHALRARMLSSILVLAEYGAELNVRANDDIQCYTPLTLAAEVGTAEDIRKLIRHGANPDFTTNKDGNYSPLHTASMLARLEAVEALIRGKASMGLKGPQGQTALHLASSEDVFQFLMRNGAPTNIQDDNGELPLHAASRRGFREAITTMLNDNVLLNSPNTLGLTPLSIACKNGHLELVRYLTTRGGRLAPDDTGIAEACRYGATLETIEAYITAGSETNHLYQVSPGPTSSCASPLHLASAAGHLKIVDLLLSNNALVDMKDYNGLTALHRAVDQSGERRQVIHLLVQKGADVNSRDKNFSTPLHIAARRAKDASSDKPDPNMDELLKAHPDVNCRDSSGRTPLHLLCEATEAAGSLQALLDAGADYNLADDDLWTPGERLFAKDDTGQNTSHMARVLTRAGAKGFDFRKERIRKLIAMVESCDLPAVESLLETGVRVSDHAFCSACASSTPEIVKRLIQAGANVNGMSSADSGITYRGYPLHLACDREIEPVSLEICKILLDAGAWPGVKNCYNNTPWTYSRRRGYRRVMKLLEDSETHESATNEPEPSDEGTNESKSTAR
ncbi:hypothetical protein OQA88_3018 [Cercophora sp. LCS_1]